MDCGQSLLIVAYDDLLEACMNILSSQDPAVAAAIEAEYQRQQDGLEMIASENYTSPAVMQAVGSVLTNKYAEGYPGRRYYGGCEHVDTIERLAIERVCQLFGAEAANVQPHSGSQANTAVYLAALQPGDVVLGLDLAQGGSPDPRYAPEYFWQALSLHSIRRRPTNSSNRF